MAPKNRNILTGQRVAVFPVAYEISVALGHQHGVRILRQKPPHVPVQLADEAAVVPAGKQNQVVL